jgi:hypothetical protein
LTTGTKLHLSPCDSTTVYIPRNSGQARCWPPECSLVLLDDSGFSAVKVLDAMRHRVTAITQKRLDAAIHDPVPPRPPGTMKRTRLKDVRPDLGRPDPRSDEYVLARWRCAGLVRGAGAHFESASRKAVWQNKLPRAAISGPSGGMRAHRVLSQWNPTRPSGAERSCHRQTAVLNTPASRMITLALNYRRSAARCGRARYASAAACGPPRERRSEAETM